MSGCILRPQEGEKLVQCCDAGHGCVLRRRGALQPQSLLPDSVIAKRRRAFKRLRHREGFSSSRSVVEERDEPETNLACGDGATEPLSLVESQLRLPSRERKIVRRTVSWPGKFPKTGVCDLDVHDLSLALR